MNFTTLNSQSFLKPRLTILVASLLTMSSAQADEQRLKALEQRIFELESRLATTQLQNKQTSDKVKSTQEIKPTEDGGFSMVNSETGDELRFSAMVQLDSRVYLSGSTATGATLDDGFLLRRVRPTWSGKFSGIGFRIAPELSGNGTGANISLLDAFADIPVDGLGFLRIGKQKTAVSIDRLRVATALPLIERGLANELAPNRDLGVSWNAALQDGKVNVVLGLFNGAPDGRDVSSRDDAGKELQARIFAQPFKTSDSIFKGLGFGIAGTYGSKKSSGGNTANAGNTLPRYRTAAQEEFFSYTNGVAATGTHKRLLPQLAWYHGNFGLVGEYAFSEQELTRNGIEKTLATSAYDLTFSWVPTGQAINFRGVQLGNGPHQSAVELGFRVSGLKIDPLAFEGGTTSFSDSAASARQAQNYGLGINWHINRNLKWSADFNSTQFSGGAKDGGDREEEQLVSTRLQLIF